MPTSWLDLLRWTLSSLLVSPLRCPVSTAPVRGSTPTACQLLCPTNSLLASRYLFRPRRDFKSKNPLSGFAPKQTKESSAWRATYIVLQNFHHPLIYREANRFPTSSWIQDISLVTLKLIDINIRNMSFCFISLKTISKVKVKLATLVEGDQRVLFSIATTLRCRGGRYSFPWIVQLYPWYVP